MQLNSILPNLFSERWIDINVCAYLKFSDGDGPNLCMLVQGGVFKPFKELE